MNNTMYIVYRMLLLIVYLVIVIDCQRGGESRSRSRTRIIINNNNHRRTGYVSGNSSSCETDECPQDTTLETVIKAVLAVIGATASIVFGLCLCAYCSNRKGRPRQDNSVFVRLINQNTDQQELYDIRRFESGIWLGRYFQDGTWHTPYQYSLTFNPQLMKVTGTGSDDVGVFTIDGIYFNETNRIGLTKTYQAGTGNSTDNLGHQVTIQLTWNAQDGQYTGKWYVRTNQYRGEGHFQLKFNRRHEFPVPQNWYQQAPY